MSPKKIKIKKMSNGNSAYNDDDDIELFFSFRLKS